MLHDLQAAIVAVALEHLSHSQQCERYPAELMFSVLLLLVDVVATVVVDVLVVLIGFRGESR